MARPAGSWRRVIWRCMSTASPNSRRMSARAARAKADAPDKAIEGFLKSTGLTRDRLVEEDTPKGRFLFARIERPGVAAASLIPAMLADVLAEFPWPKSQRWGATRFRWVRPLHRVNLLFGGAPLAGELDLGGASLAFPRQAAAIISKARRTSS